MSTIEDLAFKLRNKGHRVEILKADGEHTLADAVKVWKKSEPYARYPIDTVWAPVIGPNVHPDNRDWLWGPNFEHRAPGFTEIDTLVAAIIATVPT